MPRHNTRIPVRCLLAALAVATVGFGRIARADTNSAEIPPTVRTLLEAQGNLETATHLHSRFTSDSASAFAGKTNRAAKYLERICPACRILLTEKGPEERVAADLRDRFQVDLADIVLPAREEVDLPGPVYPDDVTTVPVQSFNYGVIDLITRKPDLWASPGYWGEGLQQAVFNGWSIESNEVGLTEACGALVRADFEIDDAEVAGEVRVDEGDSIYLVLRSDIVVKFHPGKLRGSGGKIAVKFGYDNLRVSNAYADVDEITPEAWHAFRVRLRGDRLTIFYEGAEVMDTAISRHPLIGGSNLGPSGRFGFGSNKGEGAFRNIKLTALSSVAKRRLPRLKQDSVYSAVGAPLNVLAGPASEYESLVHGHVEEYKAEQYPVKDGVLAIEGAPYAQFARKGTASDHFKVGGKVRMLEPGSVWFRANSKLLFGLRTAKEQSDSGRRRSGEKSCRVVKHSTRNFHYSDEQTEGPGLKLERWYTWELEYHEPVGTFRLDGETIMISTAPADRDREQAGPNQFGISSYNTAAEVKDVEFRRFEPGRAPDPTERAEAIRCFDRGFKLFEDAITTMKEARDDRSIRARNVLAGKTSPRTASVGDFYTVAEAHRDRHDWPTYLQLLETNWERLGASDKDRPEAQKTWQAAKEEYLKSLESVAVGEVGLDNVVRIGDRPGTMFCAGSGDDVWIYVPELKELCRYDSAMRTITGKLPLAVEPLKVVARPGYLVCIVDRADPHIARIDIDTGEVTGTCATNGHGIMDIAGDPKRPRTFYAVYENDNPDMFDFGRCRIYALDEETMSAEDTGGIGMFLATDPLGRYVYAGFHLRWRMGLSFDPSFLQIMPGRDHIDHLVTYAVKGEKLELKDQRSIPGRACEMIVSDPAGRSICYVASGGLRTGFLSDGAYPSFSVGAFKAIDLGVILGAYDSGPNPMLLAFNPVEPEAYVYNGTQVRQFDTRDFMLTGTIQMPPEIDSGDVEQIIVTPDGKDLLIAYSGDPGGILIRPVGTGREGAEGPAGVAIPEDVAEATSDSVEILSGGNKGNRSTARALLEAVAARHAFTDNGEKAAAALLAADRSPYISPAEAFLLPPTVVKDMEKNIAVKDLEVPAESSSEWAVDSPDPLYGTDREFIEEVEKLASLLDAGEEFPKSWLWECHRADRKYPGSSLVPLCAALRLTKEGTHEHASAQAGQIISSTNASIRMKFAAYSLLARIYAESDDRAREITALDSMLEIRPRDPLVHARLWKAHHRTNRPRRARYHALLSWHLYPSQPELVEELSGVAGFPAGPGEEMGSARLFKTVSPSVVLISHAHGSGTGFLIGRNGFLLTNHHVISGAKKIAVKLIEAGTEEEKSVPATVVTVDRHRDAALLLVELGDLKVEPLVLARKGDVETGDKVMAIGNPGFGNRVLTHTPTEGIISGINRQFGGHRFLQTSAAVNPGNSGGPLLDYRGRVVGMVTLKAELENVGFAIPASDLAEFVRKAADDQHLMDR